MLQLFGFWQGGRYFEKNVSASVTQFALRHQSFFLALQKQTINLPPAVQFKTFEIDCNMAICLLHTSALLLLILSTLVTAKIISRIWYHPLSRIPGPRLARISRLWQAVRYYRGTWHDDILELHATFGPIVRIAPNEVSFVDAGQGLATVYGHGAKTVKLKLNYDVFMNCGPVLTLFSNLFSPTGMRLGTQHANLHVEFSTRPTYMNMRGDEDKLQEHTQ